MKRRRGRTEHGRCNNNHGIGKKKKGTEVEAPKPRGILIRISFKRCYHGPRPIDAFPTTRERSIDTNLSEYQEYISRHRILQARMQIIITVYFVTCALRIMCN